MAANINIPEHINGLKEATVSELRHQFGDNEQVHKSKYKWWQIILEMLTEPMLILLIAVATIYFIMGSYGEAYFMLAAIAIVAGISFYQDNRSRKALEALEKINEPLSKVIRDGRLKSIPTKDIVAGDIMVVEEGNIINADGKIIHSNDFSVDESILTGEAYSVFKSENEENNKVYSGTVVVSGLAFCEVEKVGTQTKIGQLGESIASIKEEPTLLQKQIERFVKGMAIMGIAVFLLVWLVNYIATKDIVDSLLKGLTLAMSILPEEIPVAFTTFMAIGSWRLMQLGIIVKKIKTVEALGSATVICADKTGTITENRMQLQAIYAFKNDTLYENAEPNDINAIDVLTVSMWASEPVPFDPMEKTLHSLYKKLSPKDIRTDYSMLHEYPLGGRPPMMTHIFSNRSGGRIIAAKGAPEAILAVCHLSNEAKEKLTIIIDKLANKGYRILGVASSDFAGTDFPKQQQELSFQFVGFVAFYDPPKKNINKVFDQFYKAGIQIKIITGDNTSTTKAIAEQAGLRNATMAISGDELIRSEENIPTQLYQCNIFTRMFPEAKLAIINALKKQGEVVAMTGDGVNDGPALKAAHIGIAMGKKGTEIAKNAAALIIADDDLSKMVDAIAMGRRIYTNIKKAIQYIISIHIPIILTVSLPLFLGWIYPNIFTPVHVIFLELIMGPTCSIVYENEPIEKNAMNEPPRSLTSTFLKWNEMGISIVQGLMITAGILFVYQFTLYKGGDEILTRSMVFTTLILANIFLSLVNRSFYFSFIDSMKNNNSLLRGMLALTVLFLLLILYVPAFSAFFKVTALSLKMIGTCLIIAAVSVFWFEVWKWVKRIKKVTP